MSAHGKPHNHVSVMEITIYWIFISSRKELLKKDLKVSSQQVGNMIGLV
jgi:hypothetical protein